MLCVYCEILKYILQIISQDIFWEVGGGESFDSFIVRHQKTKALCSNIDRSALRGMLKPELRCKKKTQNKTKRAHFNSCLFIFFFLSGSYTATLPANFLNEIQLKKHKTHSTSWKQSGLTSRSEALDGCPHVSFPWFSLSLSLIRPLEKNKSGEIVMLLFLKLHSSDAVQRPSRDAGKQESGTRLTVNDFSRSLHSELY